ncbi:murein transglycosylase A [Methylobacterium nodulans]|uniref:peptidoglycan lytic exotransglycosylase n=1 Tax=Methylobacterium nodulans (strain LMG 21967 / CNCM I-2342 / ORS 2060) TaxID=460265 RepID=B8IHX0_METNO|nr:murein transglycosylase A [Methylobacterium nodulans]ACL56008.1 MltA domain protein [Methylobacterium nodulans ORS 2060]
MPPGFGLIRAALMAALAVGGARAEPLQVGEAVLEPVAVSRLPGFAADDLGAALAAFRASCAQMSRPVPAEAIPGSPSQDLAAACAAAPADPAGARSFFETWFDAYRITRPARAAPSERQAGFLTGYFEPELQGSLVPTPDFTVPALARPDDLVSLEPGETLPGLEAGLRAARRLEAGFAPYPDRAAIEDGALGQRARPLLYLRDAVDLLVLQVQGSGRVRLTDGRVVRLAYDGRNGQPYTSVARLLVTEGHLPLEGLTLARWTAWLRANPETARRLIRRNAAYVFFRLEESPPEAPGPLGGGGAPLTPGRSLAVDAALWRYGLPFWLEGSLPTPEGGAVPLARLVIAQDTGSAIVGPARGDLYLGTGPVAGAVAGLLRDPARFVVLLPKADPRTADPLAPAAPEPRP